MRILMIVVMLLATPMVYAKDAFLAAESGKNLKGLSLGYQKSSVRVGLVVAKYEHQPYESVIVGVEVGFRTSGPLFLEGAVGGYQEAFSVPVSDAQRTSSQAPYMGSILIGYQFGNYAVLAGARYFGVDRDIPEHLVIGDRTLMVLQLRTYF